jgi:hypothetical protein
MGFFKPVCVSLTQEPQIDMFKVYVEYVNNFDSAIALYNQLKEKNTELQKFLKVPSCAQS